MSLENVIVCNNAQKSSDIVLVDICGTIYDSNTTFDFLDYTVKKRSYVLFRKMSKTFCWRVVNRISFTYFQKDLTRIVAFKYLRNRHKSVLLGLASDFYDAKLINRTNVDIDNLLVQLKQRGCQVILVSATIDFIAETIAKKKQIKNFTATELEYQNGICLGKIKNDHLGHKLENLMKIGINPPYQLTITDNYSDTDILGESYEKVIILNAHSNLKKWNSIVAKKNLVNVRFVDFNKSNVAIMVY